jgi:hypothetical protein
MKYKIIFLCMLYLMYIIWIYYIIIVVVSLISRGFHKIYNNSQSGPKKAQTPPFSVFSDLVFFALTALAALTDCMSIQTSELLRLVG